MKWRSFDGQTYEGQRFWPFVLKIWNAVMQIAQVHRATLNNGQEVVVKVQHEGIKDVILEVNNYLYFKKVGMYKA